MSLGVPLSLHQLEPDSLLVWILAGALGLSLVFSFVAVPAQCFQLGKAYGTCLILYYLVFLCVALLIPGDPPGCHLSTAGPCPCPAAACGTTRLLSGERAGYILGKKEDLLSTSHLLALLC